MFGNPETTTGGRALKFYASIRMEIRKGEAIKSGGDVIGNRARVKVVKNKVAPPFKHCEFDIMYGTGISREGTVLDLGTSMDIIEKSGTWYSYKGERLGQGKENVKIFMKEHPEITDEVEKIIRDTLAAEPENSTKPWKKRIRQHWKRRIRRQPAATKRKWSTAKPMKRPCSS